MSGREEDDDRMEVNPHTTLLDQLLKSRGDLDTDGWQGGR